MSSLSFAAFPDAAARNAAIAAAGPGDVVESGWVPPADRDAAGDAAHAAVMATTPRLLIAGRSVNEDATKACLWDCWQPALKKPYVGIHQITGSCVGAGGGNALFSLAAADKVKRKDRERATVPFWLLPYGISRMVSGMNNRGDGSTGSGFAKAVREYGHIPADADGLPPFTDTDGYVWGSAAEYQWSVGRSIPAKYLDMAKPHLVKSTAQCRSTDDVRDALKNFYAVTCASNWGGQMRCQTAGDPPVLLNRRSGTWNHQMSVQGWWDHPSLGELFFILNQWGLDAHGRCPSGAPAGGFWVKKGDMADIVSQGETFAFSQFDGFPAVDEPLDFSAF